MLITLQELIERGFLKPKEVTGILHVGAHQCEERADYQRVLGMDDERVFWVEANPETAEKSRRSYPSAHIYTSLLSNVSGQSVRFMVTNNGGSSSMLEFKTHSHEHPHVREVGRIILKTETSASFVERILNVHNASDLHNHCNLLNIDVQGAELLVLQGLGAYLQAFDYLYLEVNEKELYERCVLLPELDAFLTQQGFTRRLTNMTHHGWGDAFYTKMRESCVVRGTPF